MLLFVSTSEMEFAANTGCELAPVTLFCVEVHVNVLVPDVEATRFKLNGAPLHVDVGGLMIAITGSGFTVTVIVLLGPTQPAADFGVTK